MTKRVEFDVIPKVEKGTIANIKQTIGDTFRSGFGASSKVRGAAMSDDVGQATAKVGTALQQLFKHITDFTGGLAALNAVNSFEAALSPLTDAVSKIDPAMAEQVAIVFEDIRAVIGDMLRPVLQAFLPLIKQFGNFVASIIPAQSAMNGFMKAWQPILDSLSETIDTMTPIIRASIAGFIDLSTTIIGAVAEIVKFVVGIFNTMIKKLTEMATWLAKKMGLKKLEMNLTAPGKSSAGAAIHQASYHGIESMGQNLAQAAFSQGSLRKPEEDTAENTNQTAQATKSILEYIRNKIAFVLPGNG